MWEWLSPPLLPLAILGLALALARRSEPRRSEAIDLGPPLLLGGALYLLAFYRHTIEPQHSFLMLIAPGALALAATALRLLGRISLRLRGGLAPLALVVSLLASYGAWRSNELRYRYRAARDDRPSGNWPPPELDLPEAIGAELGSLLPPRALGLYPAELGFNHAVAFYAWRTLLPVHSLEDPLARALAERFGLSDASRFLVLPRPPLPPSAAAAVERLGALLPEETATARGERWSVHRLP
jgi:hypothetical protein